ncbi:MAG: HAMP domain-containing sensor histidine kinase [Candidatus Latescibacterota bacterium]
MDDGSGGERGRALKDLVQRIHQAAWAMRTPYGIEGVLAEMRRGLDELGVGCDSCVLYGIDSNNTSTTLRCCEVSALGRWRELQEPGTCERLAELWQVYRMRRVWDSVCDVLPADRQVLAERLGHPVGSLLEAPFSHGAIGLYGTEPCAFGAWDEEVLEQLALALSAVFQRIDDLESLATVERQLRHVQRLHLVGQLMLEVAEQVGDPITVIIGECNLLLDGDLAPDLEKAIMQISSSSMQAKVATDRIREFIKGHRMDKEWVSLNRLVQDTMVMVGRMLWLDGIELRQELGCNLPRVEAHYGQLQQVLLNLVHNSRDALRGKRHQGLIRVTTRVVDRRVLLEVEDNGPGIPVEIRDRVFEPFFTTKDSSRASGLGLSVCAGIAKEHGGTLRLEPRVLGTCMVLDLPVRLTPLAGVN